MQDLQEGVAIWTGPTLGAWRQGWTRDGPGMALEAEKC
nr:hypothetical protein [uncultured bacterium]